MTEAQQRYGEGIKQSETPYFAGLLVRNRFSNA
jgi:hypothetical protein